nr:hypothetical protein [Tanacetum cinerariifolium]
MMELEKGGLGKIIQKGKENETDWHGMFDIKCHDAMVFTTVKGQLITYDYGKVESLIRFMRNVANHYKELEDLDGRPIRGKDVGLLIESDVFKKLDDNDAVSLCCVGILQLVLLGVEDRRHVPNWILRLANDRGQLHVERLVPDETGARSRWWVSSREYFDGRSVEDEQIPRHLNRNNYFEVPSEMYREFEEQRMGYQQMKEKNDDMYKKMTRFMEDMRQVPEANTTPIIADQHFGVIDISGFDSYQDAGILDPNLCDRARREPQPSVYILSPYTVLPPTTVLTNKKD